MTDDSQQGGVQRLKSFRNFMTFKLHMLGGHSERFAERYYRNLFGLSLTECRIIGITGSLDVVTFKDVCSMAHLEKSYASRIINRLVEAGLIEKKENEKDQRSIIISLTESGRELHSQLHAASDVLNASLLSVLSPEQRDSFIACLDLLHDHLNVMEADGDGPEAEWRKYKEKPVAASRSGRSQKVAIDREAVRQLHDMLGQLMRSS
ncbi:MarR family winged helix-turn-helix transcriptional regulator [Aurantiacibacter xanthus]|uniref:MarR family winged helix-turn-helix transcriptional regulator n=1 Tax=Aurantiacibacter xanthus TaxID=1784712 RepID=UPI001747FD18|nr:MarR family transcriptional regulator [Aurantiacibacter xanthus]